MRQPVSRLCLLDLIGVLGQGEILASAGAKGLKALQCSKAAPLAPSPRDWRLWLWFQRTFDIYRLLAS